MKKQERAREKRRRRRFFRVALRPNHPPCFFYKLFKIIKNFLSKKGMWDGLGMKNSLQLKGKKS
ncbi:hypothetical protein Rin_00019880 [Candidatus Regiella insecticola 5.15]|uniref:Uncharacterized protein n=1 Tax=Candidatus Regiella insecticola 5.15 TaxID=1005043 RepID=G2H1P5_9ENTR|nr:hypothetical protein [Candidatus Regiella insecticola]EGY28095.1 hypothetical protein Rin_00019880 [Candidatus Regiella insecticola 5.15]